MDSPDAGSQDCVCSRCGQVIMTFAIRAWPEGGLEDYEYRFHPQCVGLVAPLDAGETAVEETS